MVTTADVTALSTEVQVALSDTYLKDITNFDGSGTTIDTDKLESACKAALGNFEGLSRMTFDSTNYEHMSICVDLVRLELRRRMNSWTEREQGEYADIKTRLNFKRTDQTTYSRFSSFNSQTTGKFDDDDWSDFR